jgi:hypothetical protein
LRNPRTSPRRIPLFHLDDCCDDVLAGSLWAGLRRHLGREQPPIFSHGQRSMEAQER